MLYQLLYVSNSTISPESLTLFNEVSHILSTAYQNNEAAGITGLLLYSGGYFCQLLEGEQEPVQKIYDQLVTDHRHRDAKVVLHRPVEFRNIPSFPMGCAGIERVADPILADVVNMREWNSVEEAAPVLLYSLFSRMPSTDVVMNNPVDAYKELIGDELQMAGDRLHP